MPRLGRRASAVDGGAGRDAYEASYRHAQDAYIGRRNPPQLCRTPPSGRYRGNVNYLTLRNSRFC
jgi:hypothetical protein